VLKIKITSDQLYKIKIKSIEVSMQRIWLERRTHLSHIFLFSCFCSQPIEIAEGDVVVADKLAGR
jgi:hypothetical protein